MSLRNQPYMPLYVQDFLTDEKLAECSAEATGVYIRLLCIMHKSKEYGTILLQQKYWQTDKQIENFAKKLAKHMPYEIKVIHRALHELIEETVIEVKECKLLQKRMIRDNEISELRSSAGKKGAFAKHFAKANVLANSESEYEDENEAKTKEIGGAGERDKNPAFMDKAKIEKLCVDKLGKMATTKTICAVLIIVPEKMWWVIDKFLKKTYPASPEGYNKAIEALKKKKKG